MTENVTCSAQYMLELEQKVTRLQRRDKKKTARLEAKDATNARLKARLKAKDAANAEAKAKMKKVLEQDDVMWQSDATQSRQDRSADPVMALVMEMADRAINDKKLLLYTTKCTHEVHTQVALKPSREYI